MSESSDEQQTVPYLERVLKKINDHELGKTDLVDLLEYGRKEGFKNTRYRKKIWPLLLEINIQKLQSSKQFLQWDRDKSSKSQDFQQLKKDANRSFSSLKAFKDIDEKYLRKRQNQLLEVLNAFSKNEPKYKYFQGFHDIATIFISIFGTNAAYFMSHKLATTYLRDSFLYSFEETVSILDKLIYTIVVRVDPEFEQILQDLEGRVGFTMPWIITWFAHTFEDMPRITRIWDFLISSKASSIVYICAAVILQTKDRLLYHLDIMGNGNDMGMIHMFYQKINEVDFDLEQVIRMTMQLESRMPLDKIEEVAGLPKDTVMKQENFVKLFTLHDYYQQVKQRRAYRNKLILTVVAAGFTAVSLFYLYKKPSLLLNYFKGQL